jgi:hypothetical protein
MSLPPDPHDDDVETPAPAGAPPAPPPPPPPPPPPAPTASAEPAPSEAYTPPPSPAYKQAATSERRTRAGAGTATPATGTPAAEPAAHLAPGATKPRGKRKGWLLAAAVAVVTALGVGAAVVLLGGDDDGGAEEAAPGDQRDALGEPVEVATAFFTALEDRDCEAMIDNLTTGSLFPEEQSPEQTLATCQAALDSGATAFEGVDVGTIMLASLEGDVATVSVDFNIDDQVSTENFELQLVDGEWKLDLPGSV